MTVFIENIKKMMGWCPNATMLNKKEGEYIKRILKVVLYYVNFKLLQTS